MSTPRRYRCAYTPTDRDRVPLPAESGVLPTVNVHARNAEEARLLPEFQALPLSSAATPMVPSLPATPR